MIVTLRRYPVHTFAEFGAVPRTLGNVSPIRTAWRVGVVIRQRVRHRL